MFRGRNLKIMTADRLMSTRFTLININASDNSYPSHTMVHYNHYEQQPIILVPNKLGELEMEEQTKIKLKKKEKRRILKKLNRKVGKG
jgi:hypothetical protein